MIERNDITCEFRYPATVYKATARYRSPILKSRHFIALAWILLSAQLFSQLHGLEHLKDIDHDGHSKEYCQLCILSAGLDHGGIDQVVTPSTRLRAPQVLIACCNSITPAVLPTYQGRAPPLTSSIA